MYLKQPTRWTCYPTCVSILTDIPLNHLLDVIGHDGSKNLDIDKLFPYNKEAFIYDEIALALLKFNYALIPLCSLLENIDKSLRTNYPEKNTLVEYIRINGYNTIVGVKKEHGHHCIAWKFPENIIIDPLTGEEYDGTFPIIDFQILVKIQL